MEYIGPGIGVIGLILGLYYFLANRKTKRLNYYVRSSQALLAPGSTQHRAQVRVVVNGQDARHPHSSVVRIENTGKVELKAEDYDDSLVLDLGAMEVLSLSTATGPSPFAYEDLDYIHELRSSGETQSSIQLPKTMLNPGDYLDFQILSDQESPLQVKLRGRLAGTKIIEGPPKIGIRTVLSRPSGPSTADNTALVTAMVGGLAAIATAVIVGVVGTSLDESETKVVPDVRDQEVSEAINTLNKGGFHVGDINRIPSTEPSGTVLDQSPAPPSKADTEEGVNLVVAE